MSFSYDRYDRRSSRSNTSNRGLFTHWVPLVLTASLATAGVVAWIWRERNESTSHSRRRYDNESSTSDDEHLDYGREGYYGTEHKERRDRYDDRPTGASSSVSAGVTGALSGQRDYGYDERRDEADLRGAEDETIISRVQTVLKRTPSPQQAYDIAKKQVTAGVAAASAAVGGALGSIREEGFDDHERWSEEADTKRALGSKSKSGSSGLRKKSVVVVVSAEAAGHDEHEGFSEHASILTHLPHVDQATTNLFVLIYAPSLVQQKSDRPLSIASSYSAVDTPAQTPGEELTHIDPMAHTRTLSALDFEASQALYERLKLEAEELVSRPTMAMPFATPTGCVHMLRHLRPDTVYIAEALGGHRGEVVEQIKGWVGQVVVVVGSDGGGLGGLVDTEDELSGVEGKEHRGRQDRWWQDSSMVGLGKGVEIADGVRVGEDFERRVIGRE